MKRKLLVSIIAVAMLIGFSACSKDDNTKESEKMTISMYLWDMSMTRELTPWLESKFPEIEFEFIVGYNNMDFYNYLEERGELPDIITNRRFSLNDAAELKNQLLDLSRTELVGTFYTTYIENNRDTDGSIKWLPMCAEIDGIIANKDVFEEYNVPIPNNYAEFKEACRIFEENGVTCFYNDYVQDYSCLEAMQGCAIPELMSLEGTSWRAIYESSSKNGEVGLDDNVWPVVFSKFEQFLKDTYTEPEDLNILFNEGKERFRNNKVAMIRGTGTDCVVLNEEYGMDTVMLPYYGETEEDNWLLTYPIFQVAVNKDVDKDTAKKNKIMRVLEAIFSAEGQKKAAADASVLTYNSTVDIELADGLTLVKTCIDRNHLYQRLASTEIFSISRDVTHKMISGEYNAESAYDAFDMQLKTFRDDEDTKVVCTIDKGYDYTFTEHGSKAVSAVINTLRKDIGSEIAIGYSSLLTSSVFAGDYTEQQIRWLVNNRVSIKAADMSGAQIRETMEWLINVKDDGANPICHSNQIPATSGMEYSMKDNGDGTYTLQSITINGKDLDDDAIYSVALLGNENVIQSIYYCNCPMPESIKSLLIPVEKTASEHLFNFLSGGGKLEEPCEYVTIN